MRIEHYKMLILISISTGSQSCITTPLHPILLSIFFYKPHSSLLVLTYSNLDLLSCNGPVVMAGSGRSLEQTPTWAVAVVCFALVLISIIIEHIIHLIGKWLTKKRKRALYEALEKIKAELMLLGFISLLLTIGQVPISKICIPQSVANTWHPCSKQQEYDLYNIGSVTTAFHNTDSHESNNLVGTPGRRLVSNSSYPLSSHRRALAGGGDYDVCAAKGNKVPLVSPYGIHQLHIFIFVLALSHVLYCIVTMALGRLKMRRWKSWEKETKTAEYQFTHDPERFRFARDTSFGRRHLSSWSSSPALIWIVCFFRQFGRSVPKVDYLTLRHGFIMAHLAPQSSVKFDFQKYIKRSLEEDFKVVVGISPPIWFFAVLFLLFNTHGWYSYLWLPFIPFIVSFTFHYLHFVVLCVSRITNSVNKFRLSEKLIV
ncbi:MLO-like protein 12 [Papaver somniferum]|uniref:MLO-like protein 12 n=1 Tax=Papaver somniferum TaxID=3469 RepID=UPI000E6F5503|nr:MLO-like protein 12 [Papaver somniferum]